MLARVQPPGTSREAGDTMRCFRFGLLVSALVSAAIPNCANARPQDSPSTETEKDEAGRTYIGCQADKAGMLDDGYSDAMTIGRAIASACRSEMENLARVLAKGSKRDRVRLLLIDRLASHAAQDASVVVLLKRKRRAGASPSE